MLETTPQPEFRITFCQPKQYSLSEVTLKLPHDSVLVTQTSVIIHHITPQLLTPFDGSPWVVLSTAGHGCYCFIIKVLFPSIQANEIIKDICKDVGHKGWLQCCLQNAKKEIV